MELFRIKGDCPLFSLERFIDSLATIKLGKFFISGKEIFQVQEENPVGVSSSRCLRFSLLNLQGIEKRVVYKKKIS